MKIKQIFNKCVLCGLLTLIPTAVYGAKIETVTLGEDGFVTVVGVASTRNAVIEVKKNNVTEYMSLIKNISEDGDFTCSFRLNDANGFYTIRLNDGINAQVPDEREIFFEKELSVDKIKDNVKGKTVKIGDRIDAEALFSNLSGENIDCGMFAAMYDGKERLIGVEGVKNTIKNNASAELDFSVPALPGIAKIKIMLWGENQPPYAKSVEYDVEGYSEIYVSDSGSDANSGTFEYPLKEISQFTIASKYFE